MIKDEVQDFRDFLMLLPASQFNNSVSIAGPVPSAVDLYERDFTGIVAGVAEWYAIYRGEDCVAQDVGGEFYWISEAEFDYGLYFAEGLELTHYHILRKLFDKELTKTMAVSILGALIVSTDENEAWDRRVAQTY